MPNLAGKTAIITGAAGGQGEAAARLFVAQGAKVMLTDHQTKGEGVSAELGVAAAFMTLDVADEPAWTRVVAETVRRFGKLDILVNNAGMFLPKSLADTTADEMEQHFRVNQLGVFLGMKAVLPAMRNGGGGAIVNTSSLSGLRHLSGQFAYASTKWAVRGMTGCAAAELAHDRIRVNSVYPGLVDTPMLAGNSPETNALYASMVPLKRMASASEIAEVVAFLASDAASYVTGAEIAVDGGARL